MWGHFWGTFAPVAVSVHLVAVSHHVQVVLAVTSGLGLLQQHQEIPLQEKSNPGRFLLAKKNNSSGRKKIKKKKKKKKKHVVQAMIFISPN